MNDSVQLDEAGRVINAANLSVLKQMYTALKQLFNASGTDPEEDTAKSAEAPAKQTKAEEAALSAADLSTRLMRAVKSSGATNRDYVYIRDIYPSYFVYQPSYDSELTAVNYTVDDNGQITLGTSTPVLSRTTYEKLDGTPLEEAVALEELIPNAELLSTNLQEAAVPLQEAVRRRIKLISPGKGSSGYYPASTLKRDGPKVFTKGLKMFWDHQTDSEAAQQPEGSLDRLAAVLESDAEWADDPKHGAGLYATAKVYNQYADKLAELAGDIGVSIRATGKASVQHIEGVGRTPVIEAITAARSVDYVTTPGAGGKVLDLFEAAKHPTIQETVHEGVDTVSSGNEELKALQETVARQNDVIKLMQQQLMRTEAASLIETELNTVQGVLPSTARSRIAAKLADQLPLTEAGTLDTKALKEAVTAAVTEEAQYLAAMGVGRVFGMGNSKPISEADNVEELNKKLAEALNSF